MAVASLQWVIGLMPIERVEDGETLFRRALADAGHVTRDQTQQLRVSSNAFADVGGKPSVDLASLCGEAGTEWTQDGHDNGVLSLETREVRAQKISGQVPPAEGGPPNAPKQTIEHVIDVYHCPVKDSPPLRDNPAHAEIRPAPDWCNGSVFKKLREKLARMARVIVLPRELR